MVESGQTLTARVEAFEDASARVLIPPRTRAFLAPKHLSWKRKKQRAEDYFDVDDQILVKVLTVKKRPDKPPVIEVGFRETEPNPWPLVRNIHPEGSFSTVHVVGFLEFGALVVLPSGFEGLLHEDELTWEREKKPARDMLQVGQSLRVKIKTVIPEKERIAGSLKDATSDPWRQFAEEKPELRPTVGIVSGVVQFGLFVKLPNGCSGLVHKTRIPERLRDEFLLGDRVDVRVVSVTPDRKQVELELNTEAIYDEWSRVLEAGGKDAPLPADFGNRVIEGAKRIISVNYYERNPAARKQCLQYYGTTCVACGFSFEKVFGQLGEGFIHVHHVKPLGEIGAEYVLDPVRDLRPVCANCHAMLHRRRPPFPIEELRKVIQERIPR